MGLNKRGYAINWPVICALQRPVAFTLSLPLLPFQFRRLVSLGRYEVATIAARPAQIFQTLEIG